MYQALQENREEINNLKDITGKASYTGDTELEYRGWENLLAENSEGHSIQKEQQQEKTDPA